MKIKFRIKGHDDAVTDQGQVINNIVQAIDRFTREFDRLMKSGEDVEIPLDLSENSPFAILKGYDLFNAAKINQIWNDLPTYMYFKEELAVFEKEYNQLISTIETRRKTFAVEKLVKIQELLKSAPDDKQLVTNWINRINKLLQLIGLNNTIQANDMAQLRENIEKLIQTLK